MLDAWTPEEFQERRASDVLDPIDATWDQAGTVAAAVTNAIALLVTAQAGEEFDEDDLVDAADFVPQIVFRRRSHTAGDDDTQTCTAADGGIGRHDTPGGGVTPEELEQQLMARVGL